MTEDNHQQKNKFFKNIFSKKSCETVRETIEDLIEEANTNGDEQFSEHEQLLLTRLEVKGQPPSREQEPETQSVFTELFTKPLFKNRHGVHIEIGRAHV